MAGWKQTLKKKYWIQMQMLVYI